MTRQEEIKTLQSLKGDTYFAQEFGQDIDQMCQNISNDFPIEFGCQFNAKEESLQEQLKAQQAAANDRFMSFAHDIILAMSGCDDEIYQTVKGYIGIDEIIKFKHSQGIDLNDDEITYLVNKLK